MTCKNIGDKVLERLHEKHIHPKPKWQFLAQESAIWALFVIAVAIGSIATSVLIFLIFNQSGADFGLNPLSSLLLRIPYFWLIILFVFLLVAYFNLKHTKKGYRYNPYLIMVTSVLFSIVLGSIFYASGGGEKIETIFYHRLPLYKKLMHKDAGLWAVPEEGRLGGVIASLSPGSEQFILESFNNKEWYVDISQVSALPYMEFEVGMRIIVIGQAISEKEFKADYIMPWFGRGILQNRSGIRGGPIFLK